MNDSVSIIIKAMLEQKSKEQILSDINRIQEQINKTPLRFKVDIDGNEFKAFSANIQKLSGEMSKALNLNITGDYDKQIKSYVGTTDTVKKQVTQTTDELGKQVQITEVLNKETQKLEQSERKVTDNVKQRQKEFDGIVQKEKSVTDTINTQIRALQTRVKLLKEKYWTGDMTGINQFAQKLDVNNIDPNNYKVQLADLKNEWSQIANITQESHRNNLANLQEEIRLDTQKSASIIKNRIRELDIDAEQRQLASNKIKDQMQINAQIDKQTEQEKQVTREIEKQLAIYKEKLATENKNIKTSYGKSYNESAMSSVLSSANNLNASDFKSVQEVNETTSAITRQKNEVLASMNEVRKANTLAMKESDNFATTFIKDMGKLAIWSLAATAMFAPIRGIQEAITYVKELDNSLNEIRIVTGLNQVEVEKLAKSYNNLGKQMSVSTKDIVGQAADLFRQGLDNSQVEERMKGIIQYAKISSISLADSNKIITATANATGESVKKIIDVFSQLGDQTSSGADEIGEALQRVASASENSGLSLEKTASWLATISSITRESASTIGRSISSILSRYESIKSKGFNDEDATNLNDVTKALTAVGIQAVDSAGQLRPFGMVMDELGVKYQSLSKNEQAYITTTMFG